MTTQIWIVMASIVGFITAGWLVTFGVYLTDRRRFRPVLVRGLSWFPVSLYFLGALALGRAAFTGAFLLLSLRAVHEILRAGAPPLPRPVVAAGAAAALAHYALFWMVPATLVPMVMPALAVGVVLPLQLALDGDARHAARAGRVLLGVMLGGWSLGLVPVIAWSELPLGPHGWTGALLYLLAISQFNDFFQYIWGKLIGRRPLAPRLSPRKTWGGAIGGGLCATLFGGVLGHTITPFGAAWGLAGAALLCVGGVLGDLLLSALKRDLGLDDFGQLLPGMGGLLDRLDSLVVNAPMFVTTLLLAYGSGH